MCELLCEYSSSFSPSSELLGSDVLAMSGSSFGLWIRDPKVSNDLGNVVEIWDVKPFPDVNPFPAFKTYSNIRSKKGVADTSPLFVRSDGKLVTKLHFHAVLKSIVSRYSMELQLSENK